MEAGGKEFKIVQSLVPVAELRTPLKAPRGIHAEDLPRLPMARDLQIDLDSNGDRPETDDVNLGRQEGDQGGISQVKEGKKTLSTSDPIRPDVLKEKAAQVEKDRIDGEGIDAEVMELLCPSITEEDYQSLSRVFRLKLNRKKNHVECFTLMSKQTKSSTEEPVLMEASLGKVTAVMEIVSGRDVPKHDGLDGVAVCYLIEVEKPANRRKQRIGKPDPKWAVATRAQLQEFEITREMIDHFDYDSFKVGELSAEGVRVHHWPFDDRTRRYVHDDDIMKLTARQLAQHSVESKHSPEA